MAKGTTRKRAGDTEVTVDFSDVTGREGKKSSRSAHVPPNDYLVKCTKAELTKSRDKQTPEIRVMYQIVKGKYKGKTLIDDLYLTEGALWRLRATLEGMGMSIPDKRVKLPVSKMVGKTLGVTVDDDEYNETVRSRVVDAFLESELSDESEDLDDEDEDEDEDEDDEDEDDEDDEDDDEEDDDEIDL